MTPTQRLLRNATDSLADTTLSDRYGIARPFAPVERRASDEYLEAKYPLYRYDPGTGEAVEMIPAAQMVREVMRWQRAAWVSSSLLTCALVGSWAWWLL